MTNSATSLGISNAFFSIILGAVLCYVKPHSAIDDRAKPEDFTVRPKWVTFPTKVVFRLFEILKFFDSVTANASEVSNAYRFEEVLRGCEMIAVRSSMEFEPEWLHLQEEIHGKPCMPVGMLPTKVCDAGEDTDAWSSIKQ
ncbi:hypothetical protein GH714_042331 [Hevea brasiliensis]|uniref:Uncharacterized protein n=1 Tax=Hevea brasiliensis TaxID=3981 RepID=A0A6A6KCR9_HEVBR|nr:hypothetical protein GH714_042331 [Hevea brasiliensis]